MALSRDIVKEGHTRRMAALIPGSKQCILRGEIHTSCLKKRPLAGLEHIAPLLVALGQPD